MTTQDRTGDKLVASIRKTKAGAGESPAAKPVPTARRRAPAKRESVGRKEAAATGGYQSPGRVWPD